MNTLGLVLLRKQWMYKILCYLSEIEWVPSVLLSLLKCHNLYVEGPRWLQVWYTYRAIMPLSSSNYFKCTMNLTYCSCTMIIWASLNKLHLRENHRTYVRISLCVCTYVAGCICTFSETLSICSSCTDVRHWIVQVLQNYYVKVDNHNIMSPLRFRYTVGKYT